MKKLYPSAAAFMWGDLVITDSSSGCLRSILLSSNGVRFNIHPFYGELGELNEDNYLKRLREPLIVKELPLRDEIIPGKVMQSGRCDFLTYGDNKVVHECKSVTSVYTKKQCIDEGKPKTNNLAQLVAYMIRVKTTHGFLQYGYYEYDSKDNLKLVAERRMRVEISDSGAILVDGVHSGQSAHDQLEHTLKASEMLANNIVWERPDRANIPFSGPCHWCDYQETCMEWDLGNLKTTEEFIEHAKNLPMPEVKEPKVGKIKVKKVKKGKKK